MKHFNRLLFISILLAGCTGIQPIKEGRISEKLYSDAAVEVQFRTEIIDDKLIKTPVWVRIPASYAILIKQENRSNWIDVSKDVFFSVNVGDWYK